MISLPIVIKSAAPMQCLHHQVVVKYVQLNHQLLYTGKASDYYTYEVRDGWTLTLTNFRAWFISLVMPVESK